MLTFKFNTNFRSIKKETLTQVFSCELCEISKNTFFTEHLWATAFLVYMFCKCTLIVDGNYRKFSRLLRFLFLRFLLLLIKMYMCVIMRYVTFDLLAHDLRNTNIIDKIEKV